MPFPIVFDSGIYPINLKPSTYPLDGLLIVPLGTKQEKAVNPVRWDRKPPANGKQKAGPN